MTVNQFPRIGIVGAGTMGSGIALVALQAGSEVYLQDTYAPTLDQAADYINAYLEKKNQEGRLKKLRIIGDLNDLGTANLVIEAAPEKLDVKKEIFRQLDEICQPTAILASNTSTLSVTAIASATRRPELVAGMHFFNPAPVLPLVEVVQGASTSQETVDRLAEWAKALGKTPVVAKDTPGFIVNRVARPFYGEALRLLGEGVATHEQIDQLVESAGFKMGPFRLMDLIGIDINAGAMRSMYEQTFGEPRYRPHWIQMQKLAEGALGRKTGRGFYEYKDEGRRQKDEEDKVKRERIKDKPESGRVLISEGSWVPGLMDLLNATGYVVASDPDSEEQAVAGFVDTGRAEDAAHWIQKFDQSLPPEAPLFIQSADLALSAAKTWVRHAERLIGFDGLFSAEASAVTLVAHSLVAPEVRKRAEKIMQSLGKETVWIGESPGMILPRIISQLVNEAAFAQLEGVADGATIDIAMRLGVNYPRGPLEWGASIGYEKVLAVLDHLYDEYHEDRYRACVLIRQWARKSKK